jgi:hypothetical protein
MEPPTKRRKQAESRYVSRFVPDEPLAPSHAPVVETNNPEVVILDESAQEPIVELPEERPESNVPDAFELLRPHFAKEDIQIPNLVLPDSKIDCIPSTAFAVRNEAAELWNLLASTSIGDKGMTLAEHLIQLFSLSVSSAMPDSAFEGILKAHARTFTVPELYPSGARSFWNVRHFFFPLLACANFPRRFDSPAISERPHAH